MLRQVDAAGMARALTEAPWTRPCGVRWRYLLLSLPLPGCWDCKAPCGHDHDRVLRFLGHDVSECLRDAPGRCTRPRRSRPGPALSHVGHTSPDGRRGHRACLLSRLVLRHATAKAPNATIPADGENRRLTRSPGGTPSSLISQPAAVARQSAGSVRRDQRAVPRAPRRAGTRGRGMSARGVARRRASPRN